LADLILCAHVRSIKDKNGETAIVLLRSGDGGLQKLFRKYRAQWSIDKNDIANGVSFRRPLHICVNKSVVYFLDDNDSEPGSGSNDE
jgi:hypothetical protein